MIPGLSEMKIKTYSSEPIFEKGTQYYQKGAVISLIQRGNQVHAQVEGSEYYPYQVRMDFDEGGLLEAICNCPYTWEGWCKHITAALLCCLHNPESIEEKAGYAELVGQLELAPLRKLLEHLLLLHPELLDETEHAIEALRKDKTPKVRKKKNRKTAVNPREIRKEVQRCLLSTEGYWDDERILDEIREILNKTDDFLEQDDGSNALTMIDAITDAYIMDWNMLDGSDGESGSFFLELAEVLTEAILITELSLEEQELWKQKLDTWEAATYDYGINDIFTMPFLALKQGWSDSSLRNILVGNPKNRELWEKEPPEFASELIHIRLRILKRRHQFQEYLNLAQAAGLVVHQLSMLVQLGQLAKAVRLGTESLQTPGECHTMAQFLRTRGALKEALEIAEHGLALKGEGKGPLADWMSDLAEGMGEKQLALRAARITFLELPDLHHYLKIEKLAGKRKWQKIKQELLDYLDQLVGYSEEGKIEVLLHENLLESALNTVDTALWISNKLLHQVMDAAQQEHPDWVIRLATKHAEDIIKNGRAKHYHEAIDWLRRVRSAYLIRGKKNKWETYFQKLCRDHNRKYKLVGLLQNL